MLLTKPDGTKWRIEDASKKLKLRATLPGARVFDLAADSLRKVKAAGVPVVDQLALALPASWCVNSPAPSTVLRRWALSPQREVWVALLEVLEEPRSGPLDAETREAIVSGIGAVGSEPYGVEALSKVLALLVPDVVPLMPPPGARVRSWRVRRARCACIRRDDRLVCLSGGRVRGRARLLGQSPRRGASQCCAGA
jgi:hypothetical protein